MNKRSVSIVAACLLVGGGAGIALSPRSAISEVFSDPNAVLAQLLGTRSPGSRAPGAESSKTKPRYPVARQMWVDRPPPVFPIEVFFPERQGLWGDIAGIAPEGMFPAFVPIGENAFPPVPVLGPPLTPSGFIGYIPPVGPPIIPPVEPPVTPPVTPPVSPIPEPSTWAMVLVGFALLAGALRRRTSRTIAA